jgi:hypothetical protein
MSVDPHSQYVFGSRADGPPTYRYATTPGPADARGSTSGSGPQTVVSEVSPDDRLSTLCRRVAAAMPPNARTAVVLVVPEDVPTPVEELAPAAIATTSPDTTAVMKIEWLLREGPVRTALVSGAPIVSDRLGADRRWPRFARAVSGHDTVSAAAVPIPLDATVGAGVLAAYSRDEAAFDPRDLQVLAAFAHVVADVVTHDLREPDAHGLEGPDTVRLVNQAIGVLISRRCDEEQALRRLRRISASTRQPLVAAARLIVAEAQAGAASSGPKSLD